MAGFEIGDLVEYTYLGQKGRGLVLGWKARDPHTLILKESDEEEPMMLSVMYCERIGPGNKETATRWRNEYQKAHPWVLADNANPKVYLELPEIKDPELRTLTIILDLLKDFDVQARRRILSYVEGRLELD